MATNDLIAFLYRAKGLAPDGALDGESVVGWPVHNFQSDVNRTLYAWGIVLNQYDDAASIKVTVPWKPVTYVAAQTVKLDVAFFAMTPTKSADVLTFSAAKTISPSVSAVSGAFQFSELTFTRAEANSIAKNNHFIMSIVRDVAVGTVPGTIELAWPTIAIV